MQAPITRGRLGPRMQHPAGSNIQKMVDPYLAAGVASQPQLITNLPLVVDVAAYKGDDLFIDIAVNNPDGSATDLSQATVTAQVRTAASALDILANFEVVVAANDIHLQLPAALSQFLTPQTYWDCQMAIAGVVTTLVTGAIYTTPDVTR